MQWGEPAREWTGELEDEVGIVVGPGTIGTDPRTTDEDDDVPVTGMLYPSAEPGPFTFRSCVVRMYGLRGGAQRFARPAPGE